MRKLMSLLMILCLVITLIAPMDAEAATIKLSKSKATMEVDSTLTLKLGSLSGKKSAWTSSNKKVAAISNTGVITAKSEGLATITATYQKKKYTCKVTVVDSNNGSNTTSTELSSDIHSINDSSDISGIKSYKSTQYKVGTDLPADEYILVTNGHGLPGHYSVTSDCDGANILFKGAFDTNSIVTVKKGEYLKFSKCTAYSSAKFYDTYTIDQKSDGITLKGGKDLKPGEHKLTTLDNAKGSYCIYDSSRYEEIVVEETFTKECYVSIGEGQYLVLKGCKVESN